MPTVRTDDNVTLHYRVHGRGPRNLLFVHGFAQSGYLFDRMISAMSLEGLRCITLDMRGHGDSDKVEHGYTRDRLARDIWTVADHAGATSSVLVGFSAGARTVQFLACSQPQRVEAQVLLAGTPASDIPLPKETFDFLVGGVGDRAKMETMQKSFLKQPLSAEALKAMTDQAIRPPRAALEGFLRVMTTESFGERLEAIRVPTLVVGGGSDPFFSKEALKAGVATPIKQARIVYLPETGHYVPVERPEDTAALIEAFLAGLPAPSQR